MPKQISIKNTITLSIPKEGEISFKKELPVSEKQTPKEVEKIRIIEVEPTSFKPIKTLVHNPISFTIKEEPTKKEIKEEEQISKITIEKTREVIKEFVHSLIKPDSIMSNNLLILPYKKVTKEKEIKPEDKEIKPEDKELKPEDKELKPEDKEVIADDK